MIDHDEAVRIAKVTKEYWIHNQTPEGQEIIEILENNLQDWEPSKDNELELNDV